MTAVKLYFVVLVAVNGIALHFIAKACERCEAQNVSLSPRLMFRVGLSSAISQLGWWGALVIGFLHRHVDHRIDWPNEPFLWMAGISIVIIIAAFIGYSVTKYSTTR